MSGKYKKPILYIKPGCPWCREALSFLQRHGLDLDIRDVESNAQDMSAMISLSGQTMTPTFVYEDFIVADFSVDEFNAELNEFPEMRRALGIGHGDE
jgi:glutaredoxin 3